MSGLALQTANVSHFYDIFYLLTQLHTIFLKGTAWFFPLEISHKNHKIYLDCSIGAPYSEWSIISWFWSAAVNLCWLPLCTYNQEKSAAACSIKPGGATGHLFLAWCASYCLLITQYPPQTHHLVSLNFPKFSRHVPNIFLEPKCPL